MVLSNYVTEKIKEIRYVSVDDSGVTKKKLILQPIDSPRIELNLSDVLGNYVDIAVPDAITANHVFSGAPWFQQPAVDEPNIQFLDAVGNSSGSIFAPGGANFGIGASALNAITSGIGNTAIGQSTLNSLTEGFFNTAIGQNALSAMVLGFQNTAIGANALQKAVGDPGVSPGADATNNTAVGYNACQELTTGHRNTAIGVDSLWKETTGDYNTAVGVHALNSQVGVTGNTGIGYSSLFNNVLGTNNTAIGNSTFFATTAGNNTGVGAQVAAAATSGTDNTAVGALALTQPGANFGNRTISGGWQTAVGSQTGQGVATQVDYGTAVGAIAMFSGTGATALGAYAHAIHDVSVALGFGTVTTASGQVAIKDRHIEMEKIVDPIAPSANMARYFTRDNGFGKLQFCVRFPTGAVQVLATEP